MQSSDYDRFRVTTQYEGCVGLELLSKDPKECAKVVGMLLMHYGQLRPYSEGSKPEIIEVSKQGLCAKFNVWYSKKNVGGKLLKTIVAEAFFVKKVSYMLEKLKMILNLYNTDYSSLFIL